MGLVDDQRVIAAQHPVALDLGQQDAIGHYLHQRRVADRVGEAHRVADGGAQLRAQLFRDAFGDGARRHTPGLRVAHQAGHPAAEFETQFG
ncbi:unannotated protein [freshwater metagenome]|uniref:Unannotated protein n=1 Tax=freshwater metagenome TaxID=449393 RepID=A0A6J6ZPQ9_9ZZZZ